MINRCVVSGLALAGLVQPVCAYDLKTRLDLEPLIVKHAAANNVPAPLVHRIIIRESRYNPRAVGRGGAMGLMQIKYGTARALGYAGSPAGLLDADTNLTYGVRYLAGAYRVAGGDQNRAVGFYARGYYYDAKRKGMLGALAKARTVVVEEPVAVPVAAPQPEQTPSIFSLMFAPPRAAEPTQEPVQVVVAEPAPPAASRRRSRSVKRGTAVVGPSAVAAGPVPAESAAPAEADRLPVNRKRRDRSVEKAAAGTPAQGAVEPTIEVEAKAPTRRSGRSATRTGASGADRAAQTASGRPDDPDRRP